MEALNRVLTKELEVLEMGSKIQSQVESEGARTSATICFASRWKAIQRELGEGDDQAREIDELTKAVEAAGMPEAVLKEAKRELDRLAKMPPAAACDTVAWDGYIDWLIAVPWVAHSDEVIDLPQTKATLDADHSGIERSRTAFLSTWLCGS